MKFVKNKDIQKLLINILERALETSADMFDAAFSIHPGRKLFNPFYYEMQAEKERMYLDYLKRKKLLNKNSELSTKKILCCMTKEAACLAALAKMREVSSKPLRWDGKWRVVTFDIPNDHSAIRDFLRNYLHELGFYRFQKSVWITPYDISKYFRVYIISAKLHNWVNISEMVNIFPEEPRLKKFFKIS